MILFSTIAVGLYISFGIPVLLDNHFCIAQYRKYTLSNQYPLNLESNRFCFWQIRDMTHPRTDPMDWMRSECICILMRDLRINEHSILRQTAFTCRQSYIRDAKQFLGIVWKSYSITPRSQILYGTTWNPKAEFSGDEKLCLDTLCYPVLTHLTPLTPSLLEKKNKQKTKQTPVYGHFGHKILFQGCMNFYSFPNQNQFD